MNKAFIVQETQEYTGGIIYAKSNVEARRFGANAFNGGDFSGLHVNRAKQYDKFEQTGVPARLLIADGWHFECHGCGMTVDEDNLEETGLSADGVVGFEPSRIYCCHHCRRNSMAGNAARKAFGEGFLDMMKDRLRNRFPGTEFDFGSHRHHVYVPISRPIVVQQAMVHFSFPGMKIGPASIVYEHYGNHGQMLIGPVRLEFRCCAGDREAFEKFATEPGELE
ncbi:hypothetical protein [Roseibium sp. TrichSKD4]|uniref:hypothetical protein n=1 Tax=Roseibium sp. TrichSKD4 TaxID=744980 RepID=UPI00058B4BA5|nr:hypothetical protein [Roseibium sp. TrichSKD4]